MSGPGNTIVDVAKRSLFVGPMKQASKKPRTTSRPDNIAGGDALIRVTSASVLIARHVARTAI